MFSRLSALGPLPLLLVFALVTASSCTRSSQASHAAVEDDAPAVFARACAKCHGADGSGGLAMAAHGPKPIDLRDAVWQRSRTDEELVAAIADGRGAMPPFRDVLTADQTARLARHVRSLQQR